MDAATNSSARNVKFSFNLHTQVETTSTAMTGPPTPPPTSATEMADEVRTLPPPAAAAAAPAETSPVPTPPATTSSESQPKQAPHDSYQLLFPTLSNLAYQDDYRQIIAVAEHGDLKVCCFFISIMRYMLF